MYVLIRTFLMVSSYAARGEDVAKVREAPCSQAQLQSVSDECSPVRATPYPERSAWRIIAGVTAPTTRVGLRSQAMYLQRGVKGRSG